MSLINDALQRAKEVQQNTPSLGGSQLRFHPAEPGPVRHRGSKLMLMILGIALLVPAGFLVWMKLHPAPPPPAPAPKETAAVANPVPAPTPVASVPQPEPASVTAPAAARVPDSVLPVLARSVEPTNNDVLEVLAEPPKLRPPPLKLQGILFNESRPSAIINRRTVFVGTRIGEFRVTGISAEGVTLSGPDGTKVLEL